jgi:hypothetical protein
MSQNVEDLVELLRAYAGNERLEQIQDYVRRGRPLSGSDGPTLKQEWVTLQTAWLRDRQNPTTQQQVDIEAELKLRGDAPPFDEVQADWQTFLDDLRADYAALRQNPERWKQLNQDVSMKLARFVAEAKAAKSTAN